MLIFTLTEHSSDPLNETIELIEIKPDHVPPAACVDLSDCAWLVAPLNIVEKEIELLVDCDMSMLTKTAYVPDCGVTENPVIATYVVDVVENVVDENKVELVNPTDCAFFK